MKSERIGLRAEPMTRMPSSLERVLTKARAIVNADKTIATDKSNTGRSAESERFLNIAAIVSRRSQNSKLLKIAQPQHELCVLP